MPYAKTVTLKSQKVHLLTCFCYRFRIRHFWQDYFRQKFLNGSLEPVLAGFGIKVAVEKALHCRLSRGGGALENDVCGWSYLIVYVEIETSRFLILFS